PDVHQNRPSCSFHLWQHPSGRLGMQDRGGAHSRSVTQQMSTLCVDTTGRPTWLEVQLGYDVTDPHAVSALFRADRGDVTWTFARDLLVRGLTHPVGEGDVHVWPSVDPGAGNVV